MGSNPFNYRAPGTGGLFPTQVSEFVPQQGDISRGLQAAGQGLVNASNVLHERFLKKQEVDTKREALNLYSQFRLEDAEQATQFKQSYQGPLRDFADEDLKRRNQTFAKYGDLASNPQVREILSEQFMDYNVSQQVSSENYQISAVANKAISDTADTLDNFTNAIFRNPDLYAENLELGYQAIEAVAPDVDQDKLNQMRQNYKDSAGLAYIKSRADINPSQTLKELKSGEYDSYLTQSGLETISGQLTRELEQKRKERLALVRQDINEGMEGHITSIMQTGVPLLTEDDVSKAEDPQLLEKYRHWTQVAKKFNEVVGGTSGQPLATRAQAIEVLNPDSEDFKGTKNAKNYKKQLAIYESAKSLLAREEEQYAKDPVAFGMQNSEEVQKAFAHSVGRGTQAAINYQISRGAKPWEVELLTKQQSADYGNQLNTLLDQGNLDEAKQFVASLQEEYGGIEVPGYSYDAYDIIKNNIVDSGGNAQFIRALDFVDSPDQRFILNAAVNGDKEYQALFTKDSITATKEATNTQLRPIIDAIIRQPDFVDIEQIGQLKDLTSKLALEYQSKGYNQKDAVEKAARIIMPYTAVRERNIDVAIPDAAGVNVGLFRQRALRERQAGNIREFMQRHSFSDDKKQKPFDVLTGFADSNGFKITGGWDKTEHNKGSLHGKGRAIDIDHRGVNYAELKAKAKMKGIRVIDERQRPAGQAVWTGPHFHLDIPEGTSLSDSNATAMTKVAMEGLIDAASKDGVWLMSPDQSGVVLHTKQLDGSLRPLIAPDGTMYSKTFYELGVQPELTTIGEPSPRLRNSNPNTRPVGWYK